MKAVQFTRFGAPEEVAEIVELPEPSAPEPGHAAVELLCGPINPADLLNFRGHYGVVPTLPAIGGFEGVGRVTAVGSGVANVKPGDRVLIGGGVWRERLVVPAAGLFPLPAGLPAEQLAMLTINPLTARAMLLEAALPKGSWVIKNAANSGVGRVFFALARRAELRGIAVVRRPGLEDTLKAWGAEHVLVDGDDLPERVRALVGEGSLKYGVDAIGGAATGRISRCLGAGGTVVNYGLLSGENCQVPGGDLVFRGITVRGFWVAYWLRKSSQAEIVGAFSELLALLAAGEITTPVEATYPLTRAREALVHAARDARGGKILISRE
jgi:trans-2-enoyl-CoA reductase